MWRNLGNTPLGFLLPTLPAKASHPIPYSQVTDSERSQNVSGKTQGDITALADTYAGEVRGQPHVWWTYRPGDRGDNVLALYQASAGIAAKLFYFGSDGESILPIGRT